MLSKNPHYNAVNSAFPHIGVKLQSYWGHKEFVQYMHGLLHDTRDGQRKGFPFEILMSLHSLSDLHKKLYPEHEQQDEIWTMSNPHLK